MQVAGQLVSVPLVALLGVAVGLVAGMFGVGGGVLLTPLLTVLFGIPLPIAIGTGLCQMVGVSVAALLRHRRLAQGEPRFDLLMLPGSMVGAAAGARLVSWLDTMGEVQLGAGRIATVKLVIYLVYAALLAGSSWLFWHQTSHPTAGLRAPRSGPLARLRAGLPVDLPQARLQAVSGLGIAYIGAAVGLLSGLLGIGGGVALMPVLIYGFGFPIKQAAGTGILALLVTVSVGTVEHAWAGHVHLPLAMVLLIGSTTSAQLGAKLTARLPARTLRRGFALLIWVAIAAIAWDFWRAIG